MAPQAQPSSREQQGQGTVGLRDQDGQTDISSQTRLISNRQADERRAHNRCSNTEQHTHSREGKGEDRKVPGPEVRNTENAEHQS